MSVAEELGDIPLMLRYRSGDLAAFDILYRRHRAPLWRWLHAATGDAAVAAGAWEAAWLRLVRARVDYRPVRPFTTHIYELARDCAGEALRRAGLPADALPPPPDAPWAEGTGEPPAALEQQVRAAAAAALPPRPRRRRPVSWWLRVIALVVGLVVVALLLQSVVRPA